MKEDGFTAKALRHRGPYEMTAARGVAEDILSQQTSKAVAVLTIEADLSASAVNLLIRKLRIAATM